MRWNPDTGEFEPEVAQSLEPNADLTEWTMKLRSGVRFGNGDPLTTAEVKWSIARHQDANTRSPRRALALNITEMEIVDGLTMVFKLSSPWATFPFILSDETGMIVNPKVFQSMDPAQFNLNPRGAGVGPFEPVRFAPGEPIELEAKSGWWAGPVCIDRLTFTTLAGGQAAYDALLQDEVQHAFLSDPRVVTEAKSKGFTGYSDIKSMLTLLFMNNTNAHLADVRVRKAVAYAIDVDVLDERVNEGEGLPTSAVIVEPSRYYQGLEGPPFDQAQARQLLAQVKVATGWDGHLGLVCGNTPAATEQSVALEAMLEAVGFSIDVENVDQGTNINRVVIERNYELGCSGNAVTEENPWVQLTRNYRSDSPFNFTGFKDPAMDAALDELKVASNIDEQKEALAQVQEVWSEAVPNAILNGGEWFMASSPDLHGVEYSSTGYSMFGKAYLSS